MKTLRKRMLISTAVAGLGLGAVAVAGPMGGGDCPAGGGGSQQRMEMMQQYHAEQMELLEARLKLKPGQQAAWKAFTAAQDAHHATMMKTMQERRDKETTAMAQFEERVQAMEQNLASMKSVVKAAGDLYTGLDPEQKKVMDKFFTERPMYRMMHGAGDGPAQLTQ